MIKGTKSSKRKTRRCPRCRGTGQKEGYIIEGFGLFPSMSASGDRCDYCGGTGQVER